MSIKISELPVASTIGDNDIIPIVQESTTKSIKYEKFKPTIETTIDSSSTNDNPVGAKAVYDYSAPIDHASENTTYGQGTETKYGHCKTINNVTSASYVAGESLSAYQGKVLKGEIDTTNANLQELIDETLPELLGNKEDKSNKTNTLDENSTAEQYPTAQVTFEKYSELLDQIPTATATGNPINVQDSSNLPIKDFAMSGNATQDTNILTYKCAGTESGDYYFVYSSTNYQFTMPTISAGDILSFNTDTKKLYKGTTQITTTTASTGTLITLSSTPNPDYPQDIHVVTGDNTVKVLGVNLLDPAKFNATTYVTNIDTNTSVVTITTNSNYGYTTIFDNMEIQAGTYTFYCEILEGTYTGGNLIFKRLDNTNYPSEFNFKTSTTHKFSGNFSSGIKSLQIWNAYASTQVKLKIWFTKGNLTEMPTYQPYTEQTQLLSLGSIELAKIGTYTDRIFKDSGKWYVEKNVGKIKLDGETETWTNGSSSGNIRFYTGTYSTEIQGLPTTTQAYCNKLTFIGATGSSNTVGFYYNVSSGTTVANGNITLVVTGYYSTITELTNALSTSNAIIYYQKQTPTTTEITDTTLIAQLENILAMHTNKNVTNISIVPTGTNAEPTAEVEYRVDLGTVISNINNAIISLGGNV